jgi:hypothetical protein
VLADPPVRVDGVFLGRAGRCVVRVVVAVGAGAGEGELLLLMLLFLTPTAVVVLAMVALVVALAVLVVVRTVMVGWGLRHQGLAAVGGGAEVRA